MAARSAASVSRPLEREVIVIKVCAASQTYGGAGLQRFLTGGAGTVPRSRRERFREPISKRK